MKRLVSTLAAVLLAAGAAVAGNPVVVELFTSQGCSSCPTADRIVADLADREDVIVLSLHVDYWDYLGWKDAFASPAFTKRQRAYARARGESTVYTPQMIIDGSESVVGTKPMKIADLIDRHAHRPSPALVRLERDGGSVTIRVAARAKIPAGTVIQLVTYTPLETVEIRAGENAGRRIAYYNIARDWTPLATWDGRTDFQGTARVPAGFPVVVLVQEGAAGPILGAGRLR